MVIFPVNAHWLTYVRQSASSRDCLSLFTSGPFLRETRCSNVRFFRIATRQKKIIGVGRVEKGERGGGVISMT
jgi:hypothetical protein